MYACAIPTYLLGIDYLFINFVKGNKYLFILQWDTTLENILECNLKHGTVIRIECMCSREMRAHFL